MQRVLRVILGDQLNINHSWYSDNAEEYEYVLMEVQEESTYVRHHIQKVVGFFLAMRAFATELKERGLQVRYIPLDDQDNQGSFSLTITGLAETGRYKAIEYQAPDEYRVALAFEQLATQLSIPMRRFDTEHFLTTPAQFAEFFKGHKRYVMELFYREVRRRYDLLMDAGEPIGGRWNFDAENRKRLPDKIQPPAPLEFAHDPREVLELIKRARIPTIGEIDSQRFTWPVTRQDALRLLHYFCDNLLEHFGSYQDAMHTDYPFLFHSRLSFALNVKLISPLEVIKSAIERWQQYPDKISIEQIEGFVRQIAGWREFMRGVYWNHMPQYKNLNYLNSSRKLPEYFWTGKTRMRCVSHAIGQSLKEGYAHHIQRLMVTGNFSILAGLDPDQVDAWYLGIYVDALEWVQLPNTRGMSQFADGGIVGTKPYTSSAAYINKMSNYCSGCFYNYKEKFGDRGCPFNTLYWDFLIRNKERLSNNPRIGMGYRQIEKMKADELKRITTKAAEILERIEEL